MHGSDLVGIRPHEEERKKKEITRHAAQKTCSLANMWAVPHVRKHIFLAQFLALSTPHNGAARAERVGAGAVC